MALPGILNLAKSAEERQKKEHHEQQMKRAEELTAVTNQVLNVLRESNVSVREMKAITRAIAEHIDNVVKVHTEDLVFSEIDKSQQKAPEETKE